MFSIQAQGEQRKGNKIREEQVRVKESSEMSAGVGRQENTCSKLEDTECNWEGN